MIPVKASALALLLSGCSQFPPKPGVDSDFQQHLREFVKDAERYGIDLQMPQSMLYSIQYGDTADGSGTAIGICYRTQIRNWVVISPVTRDTGYQRTLLYHELGHCLLNQKHVEGTNTDIMNPRLPMFPSNEDWEHAVDTLFRRGIDD